MLSRRAALVTLLGAATMGGGAFWLGRYRSPHLTFEPIPMLPGFRRLAGQGELSGAGVLVGIGGESQLPPGLVERIRGEPCAALYPNQPATGPRPAAVFTDLFCPNCRLVEKPLRDMQAKRLLRLHWHHLPLLGPASDLAARAVLAAWLQGAGDAFHSRLISTDFRPTKTYLAAAADLAGIDADRLFADMTGDRSIQTALDRSRALAALFGVPGTPAIVIGDTLAIGRLRSRHLQALTRLAFERKPAC